MFVKVVAPLLAVFLAVASADLVGAPEDADINSPEVQEALRFAVAQYNAESDSDYTSQAVKVIKAQVQVVSGLKYIFNVEMAKSSCKKGEPENACTVSSDPAIAQVVAGLKYIFTVEMDKTSCKKAEAENTCAIISHPAVAQPHECKLAVWSQPWRNSMLLIENTC